MRLLTSANHSPLILLLVLRLVIAWNEEGNPAELAAAFQQEEEEHIVQHPFQYYDDEVSSARRPRQGRGVSSSSSQNAALVAVQEQQLEAELERRRVSFDQRELHRRWSSSQNNVFLGDRSRNGGRRGGGKGKGKGGARGGRGGGRRNNYYDISTYGGNPYYQRRSSSSSKSMMMRMSRSGRGRRSGRRPTRPSYYGVVIAGGNSGGGGGFFSGLFGGGGGGGSVKRPNMIRPMMTPCPTPLPTPLPTPQPTPVPTSRTPTTPVPTSQPPTVAAASVSTNTTTTTSSFRFRTELGLTYFSGQPGDVDRDLTDAEWIELQSLIGEFYTDIFQADPTFASQFRSFTPTFLGNTTTTTLLLLTNNANANTTTAANSTTTSTALLNGRLYTAGAVFPPGIPPSLAIPFDSNFEFVAGGNSITNNQLLQKMISIDYATFITNYLRRQPANQLDRVQQVQFEGQT